MGFGRQDLLYIFRSARRTPLLSFVAILALSLGIGLNAGVFTLLNGLLLSPPTQQDPHSFVRLYPRYEGWLPGSDHYSSFTTEDYTALHTRSVTLSDVAAFHSTSVVLEQGHQGFITLLVTCNYFDVLANVHPVIGRSLVSGDCRQDSPSRPALLNETTWKSQFAADPHIVGQTIHLNGLPFTVIGVLSNSLDAPSIYALYTADPLLEHQSTDQFSSPDTPWLGIIGRLRPGSSRAQAQTELTGIMQQQDRAYLQRKISTLNRKTSVILTNGSFIQTPAAQGALSMLMALILGPLSLILLLACCNVTMLYLSRSVVRRGEIAVRLALGAGRSRLLRMLLLESLLTAALAGLISIALAAVVPQLLVNAMDPKTFGALPTFRPDWHVFGYLAALVVVATVLSSLAPAHTAWKLDLVTALKGREGSATMRSKLTSSLVIAQIAMSFVLLAAAVLFLRLPGKADHIDQGFETRHTLFVPLDVDTSKGHQAEATQFRQAVDAKLRSVPGVVSLAYADLRPFYGTAPSEIRLPRQSKGQGMAASIDRVSDSFFSTFSVDILRGRSFTPADTHAVAPAHTAVVSRAFARQFWPGSDPVGQTIVLSDDTRYTIVGVAADTRSEQFGVLDGPRLYLPRAASDLDGQLFVRFTGDPRTMEDSVRKALKDISPSSLTNPQTIWELLESDAEEMRSLAHIVVIVASIAVLLAITGIYGVLSFVTQQRTRELGIRMMLGANRIAILRSILARGTRQIVVGLLFGIALATPAAWAFARVARRSPFPFHSFDSAVYAIAALLLMTVSLLAMYLPARRATKIDPMAALRVE